MIFFANTQGTITKIINEPIYQGSHNVSRVVLVAPFSTASVTVAFRLPNGVKTTINLATPNMVQETLTDVITATGQEYSAWAYLLPRSITEYAGQVQVQFFVHDTNSGLLATFTTTITIQKGVAPILPSEPTADIYTQILEYLAVLETKFRSIIIPVIELPNTADTINKNAIYVLNSSTGTYSYYVYDSGIDAFIRIDKAIEEVDTLTAITQIADKNRLYLHGNDLYYYNGTAVKLLTETDKTQLQNSIDTAQATANNAINRADSAVSTAGTAYDKASSAETTANSAQATATNALAEATNALELAQGYDQEIEEIAQTASNASSTANSASTTADSALQKAEEALNKAGSVTGVFVPKGNASSIADLPTPSAETLGWLYNMTNDFTTTADFVEGAGINYKAGENVAIIEPTPRVYKYDVFSGTVDLSTIQSDIATLQGQMADLLYKEISITSFTNNKSTQEIGSSVTAVTLTWAFNKTPVRVTLDGEERAVNSTGESLTGLSITANKTWKLQATDERNYTATRTTSISFLNGVYYGVATAPKTYDSEFVKGLTKTLRSSKLTSFTVTAGEGQYIYYCIPTRFGTASFKVGGFDGGIALVDTISFTNASGYTEDYYIYRSDYPNLGGSTVVVS